MTEFTKRSRRKKGLVIINTGNGKGKTTAALGTLLRAWGRGMKVGVVQFLKHEKARFGEIKAAQRLGIDWVATGDGFTWGQYDLLILDEFTYLLHFGWLDTAEVIAWLKANKPPMLHLIITGRDAPEALMEYADLVTEMREVKHPFNEGIVGQAGVEY
jgi:cob(I)alamin adenosyltransferase